MFSAQTLICKPRSVSQCVCVCVCYESAGEWRTSDIWLQVGLILNISTSLFYTEERGSLETPGDAL